MADMQMNVDDDNGVTSENNNIDMLGDFNCVKVEDTGLEVLEARVRQFEEDTKQLKRLKLEVNKNFCFGNSHTAALAVSIKEKLDIDERSIYIGNVDYGATAEELEQHFKECGTINRVTILCDKFSGHPKGYAYIEFTEVDAVDKAMAFDHSLFRGRQIKVLPKRTNHPGLTSAGRIARGRGRGYRGGYGGFVPTTRPRRRRGGYFSPY